MVILVTMSIRAEGAAHVALSYQFQRNGRVRFRTKNRATYAEFGKAFTATEVNKVFKDCMRAVSRQEDVISGVARYSCRVGTAIDLEKSGFTVTEIIAVGGRSGPTMPNRYTEEALRENNAMAWPVAQQWQGKVSTEKVCPAKSTSTV